MPRRARLRAWGAPTVSAVVLLFAWWAGARGLDFGRHWDEPRLLDAMREAAVRGAPLPGWYNYPSLSFDLVFGIASAEALGRSLARGEVPTRAGWRDAVSARADSPAFLVRLRAVFMSLTLLTAVWAGVLVWRLERNAWTAALATALGALSWEVGYHARWVAPDGLVMQWAILTVLLTLLSRRASRPEAWLPLAAVTAALTFSSKYPGGLVLIPLVAVAGMRRRGEERPVRRLRAIASVLGIFMIVAVAVTPGFLADPAAVIRDVQYERHHYGVLGHYGHTTLGWGDHLSLMLGYFGTAALSPWRAAAIPLALAAVLGAVIIARRTPAESALLLFFPVALILYLSLQRAMIVRNLLPAVPFLAVCAAIGCSGAIRWLRRYSRVAASVAMAAIAAALLANAGWAWHAAQTIRLRAGRDDAAQLRAVLARDDRTFTLSPGAAAALEDERPYGGTAREIWLAIFSRECDWSRWPANRVRYELLPAGPFEVNWTYYPGWWGDTRIVLVPPAAREWPAFAGCPAVRGVFR